MNDLVKNSIESRKNAIFSAYDIKDQSIIDKMEDLFKRINEFGESCLDAVDFESKFASSELNQEYIQIFTEIVTKCPQIAKQSENRHVKSDEENIKDEIASEIRYQARNATEPIRRKARQEVYETARDMPVIGEVMHAKQIADVFSGFKRMVTKNKKENKKCEEKDKKQDETN
jgi:head-tail adaptor